MNQTIKTRPEPNPLEAIQRQIGRAEQDLIDQRSQLDDDDGMAVLFTGNHHDAFPRHLVVNNYLSPTEKTTWQVIRLSIVDPGRPGATPRRGDIAAMVNCSPPTVTSSKTMLRIRGWLTYCRSVRQSGRFVGEIYLLNDEPLSLQSTLEIDATFIDFLESQIISKNQRLKLAAAEVLQEVRRMSVGVPPDEIEEIGLRVERAMTDPTHQSKIFATVKPDNNEKNEPSPAKSSSYEGRSKISAVDQQVKNSSQSKNFSLVGKNLSPSEKNFSSPSGSSSSFNINKYISKARVHTSGDQLDSKSSESSKSAAAESMANYLEIQRHGRWGQGDPDQDLIWLQRYLPWLANIHFTPYVSWMVAGRRNILPVIWQKIKPLPQHSQELVIYQLLGHMAAWRHGWRDPIRDPIAYLHRLVQLQLENRLYPDEWSLSLKRCADEGYQLNFTDSPDLKAFRLGQEQFDQ